MDPKQPASLAADERLSRQIRFILEIDRLKSVLRRTLITERRRENSAEHSWHLAVMAVLLAEYANEPMDVMRVVKMLLIHDVVEVDAGDTYVYDDRAQADKAQREQRAADRLFGLLPPDLGGELRGLWEEFEHRQTAEARYAYALDRLQPVLLNYYTDGEAWRSHGVKSERVLGFNRSMEDGAARLWEFARGIIEDAVRRGYLQA